jgi:hypothetical protein
MASRKNIREKLGEFISQIDSAEDIFQLFKMLNLPKDVMFDPSSKRKLDEFDFKKDERDKIKSIYTVLSFGKDLPVFLIEATSLAPSFVQYVSKVFSERYLRFLLFLTPDYDTIMVVFPDYEKKGVGEHKLKITKLILNKKDLHYTDIETICNLYYEGTESSWRDVWRKWRDAFNVEKVTEDFFEDYKTVFFKLRTELDKQRLSRKNSHEFTLQFLNRIMFVYFISKKRWLNNDPKFMKYLWNRYLAERNAGKTEKDSFYEKWLRAIFFKAFNNRQSEITELPKDVKDVLGDAPYLNGGLFTENEFDKLSVKIDDSLFKTIFEFFEKYNFTIREDMPLESEVAVDPQMLGYVYESLANVAEEIYDRNDLGIFYTPRVEVDFMCRRSLVEYLSKHLPDVPKEKFYQFVFDDDKEEVEQYFKKESLWHKLEEVLDRLSVVDPACGSGAFLVGMLRLLAELYRIVYKHIKRTGFTDFSLKEQIVGRSLYGVDVMSWAVHAAELRLWLQLIVEAELSREELRKRPLLPNLNLNLRVGDSLVQEIGGINLHLRTSNISTALRDKLFELRKEKERYFYNNPSKFSTKEEIIEEETRIFGEIIDERIQRLNEEEGKLEKKLKILETGQRDLYGKEVKAPEQKIEEVKNSISNVEKEVENLRSVKKSLKNPEKKPFVWEIDFAEIFGDKDGFDIVIGNPPYVSQEKISPPNRLKTEVTLENRRKYKDNLLESVQAHLPIVRKIGRKSDYYIYFYFHGLSILNEKGTFCFITSNSWLDVGYGSELQEFLLKYVPITAIYDNPKRAFAHADINTIIAVFGSPKINKEQFGALKIFGNNTWPALSHTAKFVMFRKPFEQILSSKNLVEIEKIEVKKRGDNITDLVKNAVKTDDYRVFPITQEDLLQDSWEYPEDYNVKDGRFKQGEYGENKWGVKYLRAPDIFYVILEKGMFRRLRDYGKIETYLNTGGADKFYFVELIKHVDKEHSKIKNAEFNEEFVVESDFLQPVIKSSQELSKILVQKEDVKSWLVLIDPEEKISKRRINEYVRFGVKKGYNRRSGPSNRKPWWRLPDQARRCAEILFPRNYNDKIAVYYNPNKFIANRFYRLDTMKHTELIKLLNSTLNIFMMELFGRKNLGQGALDLEKPDLNELPVLDINEIKFNKLDTFLNREIKSVFGELGVNPTKSIREQEPNPLPDRKVLDDIVFDALGLTEQERKEVYWAVCELVKERLDKARSLKRE